MRKALGLTGARSVQDVQSDSDEFELELATPVTKPAAAAILCDNSDDGGSDMEVPDVDPARPHLCRICKKGFTTTSVRDVHQRTVHSEKKPWRCSECNMRFKWRKSAVRHQTIHSDNPKPWLCPVCKVSCNRKESVIVHIKKLHGFELRDIPKVTVSMPMNATKSGGSKSNSSQPGVPPKQSKQTHAATSTKPPPGRIKTTPTTGQKRKREPKQEPEPDSGIDLPSLKPTSITKQQVKQSKHNRNPTKKHKPSYSSSSSSDYDSGFNEE